MSARDDDSLTAPAAPAPTGPLIADEPSPQSPPPPSSRPDDDEDDSRLHGGEHGGNVLNDYDSALGMDAETSSTRSIHSSILRYREEHGRTYHGYKPSINYVLPNDELEQDRLDLQHHLCLLTFDGNLFLSPAEARKPISRVLDIGTGTGMWAMDFADEHPEAEVIGVDLSPIQPNYVPSNVYFQIDDIESDWTFGRPFDFIFCRMMTGSIKDYPQLARRSFANLTPGSWMEFQEFVLSPVSDDGTLTPESPIMKWADLLSEGLANLHIQGDNALRCRQDLLDAGFVNVRQVVYKWPLNPWPKAPKFKEIGMWAYENVAGNLSGVSMAVFTRGLGWKASAVEVFLAEVRRAMKDRMVHAYWPIYVVYGQKPEAPP